MVARGRPGVVLGAAAPAARVISVTMLLCVLGWVTVLAGCANPGDGRFWRSLALLAAAALIARGIFLGRPVTTRHAWAAAGAVSAGRPTGSTSGSAWT